MPKKSAAENSIDELRIQLNQTLGELDRLVSESPYEPSAEDIRNMIAALDEAELATHSWIKYGGRASQSCREIAADVLKVIYALRNGLRESLRGHERYWARLAVLRRNHRSDLRQIASVVESTQAALYFSGPGELRIHVVRTPRPFSLVPKRSPRRTAKSKVEEALRALKIESSTRQTRRWWASALKVSEDAIKKMMTRKRINRHPVHKGIDATSILEAYPREVDTLLKKEGTCPSPEIARNIQQIRRTSAA